MLITKDGTIGKVAYINDLPRPATLNSGVFLVKPKDKSCNSNFLYYILTSNIFANFLNKLSAGSTINHLYQKDLVDFEFLAPPTLEEQKAIVSALSDIDVLISSLEKLIEKKQAIKQGAMQQLLTGKKRLDGFSGEWENINLADNFILKARIGWQGLTTDEYLTEGYAYLITGVNFNNGQITWNKCHFVNYERYRQDPNIKVFNGDILITKDGTIGKIAFIKNLSKPATLNSGIFSVKLKTNLYSPKFLYYILRSNIFEDFLSTLSAGSTINHLYQKDLVNFEFLVPPTSEEQERIALILNDMDNEIDKLKEKLEKYKQIRQGMMSELLTGRIRLF